MTRTSDTHIDLFDADGRCIGRIVRPLETEALGPGREKVLLVRSTPAAPAPRPDRGPRTSQAA